MFTVTVPCAGCDGTGVACDDTGVDDSGRWATQSCQACEGTGAFDVTVVDES